MICPYCGFEYGDGLLRCPHCGAENTAKAREHQQEALHALTEEQKAIHREPERVMKQANRTAARIGVRLFAGVLVSAILTVAGNFAWNQWKSYRLARNVESLNAYLLDKDYDSLCQLLDEIDAYNSAYKPYYPVETAFQNLTWARQDLEWFQSDLENGLLGDYLLQSLSFALCSAMNVVEETENGLEDDLYLGNEEALQDLQDQARRLLTEDLKMTEAEIEEMSVFYENTTIIYDETLFLPYASLSLERLE